MARLFDGFVALEMVVLGILEISLCFLVFYIILLPGDVVAAAAPQGFLGLHHDTANHAAILRKLGRLTEAENAARTSLALAPGRAETRNNLGNITRLPKKPVIASKGMV